MTAFIKCLKCGRFKKETLDAYAKGVDNWNEEPCECEEEDNWFFQYGKGSE